MSRKLVLVPPRENVSNPEAPGDKATFCLGIGGPVEAGTDVAPHYMVRKAGRFFETCANAKIPSETEMVLDILKSSDQGAHWYSIFPDGSRIAIPAGSTQQVRITRYAANPNDAVAVDDWLGMDVISGDGAEMVEVVTRWR